MQNLSGSGGRADAERVLAPKLEGIHTQFMSQDIHVGFDGKGRLGHAKPPERAGRRIIGVHGIAIDLGMGHLVGTGGVGRGSLEHLGRQTGIGPGVADQLCLDGRQRAIPLGPGLDADNGGVSFGMG